MSILITNMKQQPIVSTNFEVPMDFRTVTTVKGAPGRYGLVLDGSIPDDKLASLIRNMGDLNALIELLYNSRSLASNVADLFPRNGRLQSSGTVSTTPKQVVEQCRKASSNAVVSEFIAGILHYSLSTAGIMDKVNSRLIPVSRDSRLAGTAILESVISMEVLAVIKETSFTLDLPAKSTIREVLEDRIFTMLATMGRQLARRMITITDTVNEGMTIVRTALEQETGIVPNEDRLDPTITANADLEKLMSDVAVVHAALKTPSTYVKISTTRSREILSTMWSAISTAPWLSHETLPEFLGHYGTIRLMNNLGEYNAVIAYANYDHHQESPVGMMFPHAFASNDTDMVFEVMADQMDIANGALSNLLVNQPIKDVANRFSTVYPSLIKDSTVVKLVNMNMSDEELFLFSLLYTGNVKLVAVSQTSFTDPNDDDWRGEFAVELVADIRVNNTPLADKTIVSDFGGTMLTRDPTIGLICVSSKEPTSDISIKGHNIPASLMSNSIITHVNEKDYYDLNKEASFQFNLADGVIKTRLSLLQALGVRSEIPRPIEMMLNLQYPALVRTVLDAYFKLEDLRVQTLKDVKVGDLESMSGDSRGGNLGSSAADRRDVAHLNDFELSSIQITIAKEIFNMLSAVGSSDRGKVIRQSMLQQIKNSSTGAQRSLLRYESHRRHLTAQLNVQSGMLILATFQLVPKEDRDRLMDLMNDTNIYALVT